jgi:hypothetical protein
LHLPTDLAPLSRIICLSTIVVGSVGETFGVGWMMSHQLA